MYIQVMTNRLAAWRQKASPCLCCLCLGATGGKDAQRIAGPRRPDDVVGQSGRGRGRVGVAVAGGSIVPGQQVRAGEVGAKPRQRQKSTAMGMGMHLQWQWQWEWECKGDANPKAASSAETNLTATPPRP